MDANRPPSGSAAWTRIAWTSLAILLPLLILVGFEVLGRYQQNGPPLDPWSALCRALGVGTDPNSASRAQPALKTPTRVAWDGATLAAIAAANPENGEFVAINCSACHGEHGVSSSASVPTLAGMDAAVIYKQLDDYRSGTRSSSVMKGIATALGAQDTVNVAAYFARLPDGLPPIPGEILPHPGRSFRQPDPAIRLIFAGDPGRGIAPCSVCHGPVAHKLGAPALEGQRPDYLLQQIAAFSHGARQNDIDEQMRTVAREITPDESQAVARYYGGAR